jgi:hypothetical protein
MKYYLLSKDNQFRIVRAESKQAPWIEITEEQQEKIREGKRFGIVDGMVVFKEKTPAQLAVEKQAAAMKAFRAEYPVERELSIMRAAVASGDATEAKKMHERYLQLGGTS